MPPAVQPWIAVTRGVDLPPNAESLVQTAFEDGATWWRKQMNRTFAVAPTVVHRSDHTFDELRKKHGEQQNIWFALQREAHDAGLLQNCDPERAHYMVGLGGEMGGGMVGSENFGCSHILPGKAAITGGFAYVLLSLDPTAYGHPAQPWFASERRQATGALMHELGHVFGDGVKHPLDHTSDDKNLMYGWWNWPDATFTPGQIAQLGGSPFLR
ncbi:MAG: hypothetical protein ABI559_03820 [Chloroflexota bacterium]